MKYEIRRDAYEGIHHCRPYRSLGRKLVDIIKLSPFTCFLLVNTKLINNLVIAVVTKSLQPYQVLMVKPTQ